MSSGLRAEITNDEERPIVELLRAELADRREDLVDNGAGASAGLGAQELG